jgi:hypothetical protein
VHEEDGQGRPALNDFGAPAHLVADGRKDGGFSARLAA